MIVHDISPILGSEAPDYPGDPPYRRTTVAALAAGDGSELSRFEFSAHAGAHLDAPAHFIPGGRTIDRYPAAAFILPALVAAIEDPEAVRPAELDRLRPRPAGALLFRTRNSTDGLMLAPVFAERWVHLAAEAAAWCVARKLALVGIDGLSVDRFRDPAHPAHHALLGAGILVLEGINLRAVAPGPYTLVCLPLRAAGAEASPVRAVLIEGFPEDRGLGIDDSGNNRDHNPPPLFIMRVGAASRR